MTIFLDYYRYNNQIIDLGVREENGLYHNFHRGQLDRVVAYLMGQGPIVVFKKPKYILMKELVGLEHYLEDQRISERWTDLWLLIKNDTGVQTSLTAVVEGSLGEEETIPRFETAIDPRERPDAPQVLEKRLALLHKIYNYAIQYDQLSLIKDARTITAEIYINENP